MASFDEFESRLQSLLEVHLLKYLPGYKVEDGIAQQLATAMRAHLKKQAGGMQAPNIYVIVTSPSTLDRWRARPRLLKELALYAAGNEAGFQFSTRPTVATTADDTLPANELRIVASFSQESVAETQGMDLETRPAPTAEVVPHNAFLIVGGTRIIPLNHSVINIGRRLDNHIVIDDPRVSRTHAQLRIVRDRYVLFDLNSSGGTFVNGERADQSVLYPGDVISLAGITLVFGQDFPAGRVPGKGQTEPGSPVSGDRTTASLEKHKDNNK